MRIPFNRTPQVGSELEYVAEALRNARSVDNQTFASRCEEWFENRLRCQKAFLTASCTAALEMAAILLEVNEEDEIILPSFTFASTGNAFALRGAKLVFVDIEEETLNIDPDLVESAITQRTKAIVPVHYAGVSCDMTSINSIAEKHRLVVIEDAAQGVMSTFQEKPLGTFGQLAAYSFHETKNITSGGRGGLLIVNDSGLSHRAEIIHQQGTNRGDFFRGLVEKYNWIDIGSSFSLSEIQAAYLWAQLQEAELITQDRLKTWTFYYDGLKDLQHRGHITLPEIPSGCSHNGHMFFLRTADSDERSALLDYMNDQNINAVFHYSPLHISPAGRRFGRFHGTDAHTSRESGRLIRLPLWFGMSTNAKEQVVNCVRQFYL